jgi:long-subunit fatty acid transport protein
MSLQFNVSGETKGLDTLKGENAKDTGITSVFLGPKFAFTWKDKLSADVGVDVPVLQDNTALQIVPDVRVRTGVSWRF